MLKHSRRPSQLPASDLLYHMFGVVFGRVSLKNFFLGGQACKTVFPLPPPKREQVLSAAVTPLRRVRLAVLGRISQRGPWKKAQRGLIHFP